MTVYPHAESRPRTQTSRRAWRSKPSAIAFAIALAATLVVALLQGAKPFYDDSGGYWSLGETFTSAGHFSLLNFTSPLRGYLLPLIYHGVHELAAALGWTDSSAVKILLALSFALIGAVLAPKLAELAWPQRRWSVSRRVCLMALLIVFWSGYLNYPLSDFPALALALLALVSVSRPRAAGWMLLAGAATGAAIDMRPSYLLLAPIVLVLAAWNWADQRSKVQEKKPVLRGAFRLGLLALGFVIVSLPQSLSTHRHFGSWSFVPGSAAHLENVQLEEGLRLQRYETFVGAGHLPQMAYEDEAGAHLLSEQPGAVVTSTGMYLGLVVDHPLTIADLYARHVINGLDERYSTPYVEHLSTGANRWLRLAGFLLVFLALLRVVWPAARRSLGGAHWRYPVALVVCTLTAVPSAMEPRYLLPVYLLGYMLVLAPGWPNPITNTAGGIRRFRTLATIGAAYVLYQAVVWHVVSGATSHFHFG